MFFIALRDSFYKVQCFALPTRDTPRLTRICALHDLACRAQILYYGSRLGCLRIPEGAPQNTADAVFFQCTREGFFFSSKRAALPPNPAHAPADVKI